MKGSINQEDTAIISVHEHNNKSPEYMARKLWVSLKIRLHLSPGDSKPQLLLVDHSGDLEV